MKALSLFCAAALFSTPVLANTEGKETSRYAFTGDVAFANFCRSALKDDVALLRRSVFQEIGRVASSENGVYRTVLALDGLKCDGLNLVDFARQRQAESVYQYLSKKAQSL